MFFKTGLAAIAVIALGGLSQAQTDVSLDSNGLSVKHGNFTLKGRAAISFQGAHFQPVTGGPNLSDTQADGTVRLILEYKTDNAVLLGIRGEIDTGNDAINEFERDEFYVYIASDWGRVEIGENDGPADTLSFSAPRTGHGQVRGDFARYTGTVAMLTPYDSRDTAKLTYYSPPYAGFRAGVSYSPEFTINANDIDVRRRTIQNDVVEVGAQYVRPFGDWVAGISAAWVSGKADPATIRGDIDSWSIGMELRRGEFLFGAAYVDRKDSNLFSGNDIDEINAGAKWTRDRWSVAVSTAITESLSGTEKKFGIGGEYKLTDTLYARADAISLNDDGNSANAGSRDGFVLVSEIGLRF